MIRLVLYMKNGRVPITLGRYVILTRMLNRMYLFSIILFLVIIAACSFVTLTTVTTFASGKLLALVVALKMTMLFGPLFIVATMIFGRFRYHGALALVYSIVIFWIPILIYLFFASALLTILYIVTITIGIHLPLVTTLVITLLGIAALLIYGIYNALTPNAVHYRITAPTLSPLWSGKKIAVISDVHLGMVRRERFMKKVVDLTNAEKPDIIFIAGDLIDGPVIPYEEALAPLSELKSTFGAFYTAGNHDEYNRDQEAYYQALGKHVTVLNDQTVTINDTTIVGLIYAHEKFTATRERLSRAGFTKNDKPSIAILHDPKNAEALAEAGISLIISGHTHSGQFFPLTLFVKAIYKKKTKGHYTLGETAGFTSVGVGTAGPLLRIGTDPEVAILTIV